MLRPSMYFVFFLYLILVDVRELLLYIIEDNNLREKINKIKTRKSNDIYKLVKYYKSKVRIRVLFTKKEEVRNRVCVSLGE